MRRPFGILTVVLVILLGVGIGAAGYHAGYVNGLEASGRAVEVVRGPGWGFGFFPFGFFLFPLFFFALFAFGRRSWHGPWAGHHQGDDHTGNRARFDEWHRSQHDRDATSTTL